MNAMFNDEQVKKSAVQRMQFMQKKNHPVEEIFYVEKLLVGGF